MRYYQDYSKLKEMFHIHFVSNLQTNFKHSIPNVWKRSYFDTVVLRRDAGLKEGQFIAATRALSLKQFLVLTTTRFVTTNKQLVALLQLELLFQARLFLLNRQALST